MAEQKKQPEYPSEAQMNEMRDALESGDDQRALQVLRKRREEQQALEKAPESRR
jgi:hypothetical protein